MKTQSIAKVLQKFTLGIMFWMVVWNQKQVFDTDTMERSGCYTEYSNPDQVIVTENRLRFTSKAKARELVEKLRSNVNASDIVLYEYSAINGPMTPVSCPACAIGERPIEWFGGIGK